MGIVVQFELLDMTLSQRNFFQLFRNIQIFAFREAMIVVLRFGI